MKIITWGLLLLSMVLGHISNAQSRDTVVVDDEYEYYETILFPKFRLGISPSSIINILPAVQVSADMSFNEGRANAGLELGYIYSGTHVILDFDNRALGNAKGIQALLSYDIALSRTETEIVYIGLAYHGKMYREKNHTWTQIRSEGYQKLVESRLHRQYHGGVVKAGVLFDVGENFYVDFNIGTGAGSLQNKRYVDSVVTQKERWYAEGDFFFNINLSYDLLGHTYDK